uniref:Ig-like domain-containing protein n=1 Tax=Strigamia maritima TaxID=126957 RepID=T1J933_STRMM
MDTIVLKISILSTVVLFALATATGVTAEKHFLQAERNESTSFECSKLKTTGCELYKYVTSKQLVITRTQTIDKRFTIRDSEFCIIDMNTLKTFDSGEYHCITDKDYEVFYLDVKGKPSKLFYNDKLWRNNSENLIHPNEHETVNFKCHSYLQKTPNARTSFVWSKDNVHLSTENQYGRQNDDLWEAESNIQIHFGNGGSEKKVECKIQTGTETEILIGTFGMPYSTKEVSLEDNSVFKERIILEDEVKEIACKGDGFPFPKDIMIKKQVEDEKWEAVAYKPTFNVVDSGTYLCEARNDNGNGTIMEHYIASNKLSFRNYDRELAIMSQMLSDLNDTVTELQQKVLNN